MRIEREKLDFTDKELNMVARAIKSFITNGDTYLTRGTCMVMNSAIKKICDNGLRREAKESIMYPLIDFDMYNENKRKENAKNSNEKEIK